MLEKPPILSEIFKEIRMDTDLKWSNWPKIVKKNERFAVARRTFSRKKPLLRQVSEYLASPHLFQFIQNTPVQQEIDMLSQNLLSAKKIFKLRRLGQKKKMDKLSDCYLLDGEFEALLTEIFKIFRIEEHVGTSNKEQIATWILDTVLCRQARFRQIFVYKEAPFARAFRSKSVMSDKLPVEKRGIQMLIVNNLMAGVFWWILIAIRQCISVIPEQRSTVLLWRSGHLEMLKNEMTDFRKRYSVRRLKQLEKAKLSIVPRQIGRLKFTVIRQKFRPVFPKITGKSKYAEFLYWKRINSMIDWCFNQKGIDKQAIRQSCSHIYRFLREKQEKSTEVTAFTADITKCFSTLKHEILIDILEKLINQDTKLYSVCGRGHDNLKRWKVVPCTATTGVEVVRILKEKMKLRKVEKFEQGRIEASSTKWLLNELRSSISSYYFNRGKTTWKVTKGVPQGHPLSSHLAHVYLNEFEKENWKMAERKDTVYARYEDDYVICTTDKDVVDEMLDPLFSGENRFGLVANREKSQISSSNLKWCGVNIDLENCKFSQKIRCNDKKMRQVTLTEKQLNRE